MISRRVTAAEVAEVVQAGLSAPSGDNCQPWRFVWQDPNLDIYLVPGLADSLYDVDRTASWISLGAMLTNIGLVARRQGLETAITLFPSGASSEHAARIRIVSGLGCDEPLAQMLEERCVNRRPYARTPLAAAARTALVNVAQPGDGICLDLVEDPSARDRLAALAAANDQLLFENRVLHDGLFRWIRWSRQDAARSGDGMPAASLELSAFEQLGFRLLGWWPAARVGAALGCTRLLPLRTRFSYQRSSAIGLLSADGIRPEDFVRGGETLERIWLTATAHHLAFQPITGITFLWLRCRLHSGAGLSQQHQRLIARTVRELQKILPAFGSRTPFFLFRIGYAPAPSARSPRRAVDAVLTMQPPE